MTESNGRREAREIGSPVRFFGPDRGEFDMDFAPRPVPVDDVHPTEVEVPEVDPKASSSSATEPAESYSDLIPESQEVSVSVEPETPPEAGEREAEELEVASSSDPALPTSTSSASPGAPALPALPSKTSTSSSQSAVK